MIQKKHELIDELLSRTGFEEYVKENLSEMERKDIPFLSLSPNKNTLRGHKKYYAGLYVDLFFNTFVQNLDAKEEHANEYIHLLKEFLNKEYVYSGLYPEIADFSLTLLHIKQCLIKKS